MILPNCNFFFAAAAERFSFLLTETGAVYAVGTSNAGVLGVDRNRDMYSLDRPEQVPDLPTIRSIACGDTHVIAISHVKGEVYGWGNPQNGKLGINESTAVLTPRLIPVQSGGKKVAFKHVSCAAVYSLIQDTDDRIWSAGIRRYDNPKEMLGRPTSPRGDLVQADKRHQVLPHVF